MNWLRTEPSVAESRASYVERVGDDGFTKASVGAGPDRVVSFSPGVELALEALDGYSPYTVLSEEVRLKRR